MTIQKVTMILVGVACICGQSMFAVNVETAKQKNLIKDKNNLLSLAWKTSTRRAQISKSEIDGPGKQSKAFRLSVEKNGFFGQSIRDAVPGKTYKFSIWMKSATDKQQVVTILGENTKPAPAMKFAVCKVTDKWQKFSVTIMCPENGNYNFRFSIRRADVFVWEPSVREISTDK